MLFTAEAIVTGSHVLRPGWLDVSDGEIAAIGAGEPPRALTSVDHALGEVVIVPGFVDMHVHGGGGGSFPDATPEAVATAVGYHRSHGTTRMLASLVAAHPRELLTQVGALAEQVDDGQLAGIHLEGPWMSPNRLGAHDLTALRHPDLDELDRVITAGRGTVKMVTIAPELPGALEAIRRFVDAGVVAAVGHTDATYDEVRAAIAAGARVATHLFNAMRPLNHREPGPILALLEDDRVRVELINDRVHLHPALHRDVTTTVGADRVALITDSMSAAGMSDGKYRLGTLDVEVTDGVAKVAGTDTIAGSTATMDRVFEVSVTESGNTPSTAGLDEALLTAVRQACLTPATALGLPAPGLAPGAPADFVVLNPQLGVEQVWRAGERDST